MLWEDLERYNEAGHRRGSLAFWKQIAAQAYTHPGLLAVAVYRYGRWVRGVRVPGLRQLLDLAYHLLYSFARFGLQVELPRDFTAGPGLRVDHYGGVLATSGAVVGRNFTMSQGVLLGSTESGAPRIGDDVHCGVGTKIIGGIELGDCIKIGTGSVVTKSFPGHAVIAGVPARFLRPLTVPPQPNGWIPPAE
ncbi:MAG: serine O-acetyltransferase [Dehalococcoidia bacterium]